MKPTRVAVIGAMGRMGQMVRQAVERDPDLLLGGALERTGHPEIGNPIDSTSLTDEPAVALQASDVAIDFSLPESTLVNMQQAANLGVAYVTGTTGFDAEGLKKIQDYNGVPSHPGQPVNF